MHSLKKHNQNLVALQINKIQTPIYQLFNYKINLNTNYN